MLTQAQDEAKRLRLTQKRRLATGALIVAALLYAASIAFQATSVVWPYVSAFAEAAMVGALADWFAVTALFRQPLGLSFIPHTAIIPRNKDRIADNLGEFVQGEFFSTERVLKVIQDFNPAQRAAAWLAEETNAERLANGLGKALLHGLSFLDQNAVQNFLKRTVAEKFSALDLSTLTSNILQGLTHNDRHQVLLDQALHSINDYLNTPSMRDAIAKFIGEKLPSWLSNEDLKAWLGGIAINKILGILGETVAEIDVDPHHPLRAKFHNAVQDLIDRLKHDSELRNQVKHYQEEFASNKDLAGYVDSLWRDIHDWLHNDLTSENSVIRARVSTLVVALGKELLADERLQAAVNGQIMETAPEVLESVRPRIGAFISSKMKEWKEQEIVEKLELNIGPDLQYIRLNGTLVGGLVGLLIHTATMLLHAS